MLRIVDYAKGKDIEWYEVIRQAINESSVAPVESGGDSWDYTSLDFYINGSYHVWGDSCNSGSTSSWCEYSTTLSAGVNTLRWCSDARSSEYEYVSVDSLAIPD